MGVLSQRILLLLPVRTGRVIEEVELDPQFVLTTKIIHEYQRERPSILPEILLSFTDVLQTISAEAITPRLQDRDVDLVALTLIICKLLSGVLKRVWNREKVRGPESSAYGGDFIANYSQFHHFDKPMPMSDEVFSQLINVYVDMTSPRIIHRVLELASSTHYVHMATLQYATHGASSQTTQATHNAKISSTTPQSQSILQSPISSHTSSITRTATFSDDDDDEEILIQRYLEEIDSHIGFVIRYIAGAAPEAFHDYMYANLFVYFAPGVHIPIEALRKYLPLLRYMFYTSINGKKNSVNYDNAMTYIRLNSWRRIFLIFATLLIQDQSFSRPEDYHDIIGNADPEFQKMCRRIFKQACEAFDNSLQNHCAVFVFSWLVTLCLDGFETVLENTLNTQKLSRNRAEGYLSLLLWETKEGTNLEAFDAIIKLFHLGARLVYSNLGDHPVARFSLRFLEPTHVNLMRFAKKTNHYTNDPELSAKYNLIYVNFFSAALMINPTKYVDDICIRYEECCHDIREVRLVVKVLRAVSESQSGKTVYKELMKRLAPRIKGLIYCCTKILKFNESITDTESLLATIYSENNSDISATLDEILSSVQDPRIDHHISQITDKSLPPSKRNELLAYTEELLADLFVIFISAPEAYFNDPILMSEENLRTKLYEENANALVKFACKVVIPLRFAFTYKIYNKNLSGLFEAACDLAYTLVSPDTLVAKEYTTLSTFCNYHESNLIVQSICDTCIQLSLTNTHFKSCFILIQNFLNCREQFRLIIRANSFLQDPREKNYIGFSRAASNAIEKVLLLSLCTHDIQFYSTAKMTMKWYCNDQRSSDPLGRNIENLCATFKRVVEDTTVFTGFASLHKKFRTILKNAWPTKSLSQVWAIVYTRWCRMLENKELSDANLILRHYTGFLVCTAGCFYSNDFSPDDKELSAKTFALISEFFDKCIGLLSSLDLVVRVVVKDSLLTESHPSVYHIITSKVVLLLSAYTEKNTVNEESTLLIEQIIVIFTSMVSAKNEGSFVLAATLLTVWNIFSQYCSLGNNLVESLRLKLRFCKLIEVIESEKEFLAVTSLLKMRNSLAKVVSDWMEQAIFLDDESDTSMKSPKDHEVFYLKLDLAAQASKALALNLDKLKLELPEGTKDSEIKKYKDLAFGMYFSMFYKIIEKLTSSEHVKQRNKINMIIENVLRCMSNILQYDTDIGMQFVLLLGYHENSKIRSLFISMYLNMLVLRESKNKEKEYTEETMQSLTDMIVTPGLLMIGPIADTASLTEHNLLASSLFGIFKYTKNLDMLFSQLMTHEFEKIIRPTDMLRRNSTLTRLLLNFANDYGRNYLERTLKPFILEIVAEDVTVEVERVTEVNENDTRIYMNYLNKLIDIIDESSEWIPNLFKYICSEIYDSVKIKFEDAALVAVGSFIFLRFLCPAIISPEAFFKINITNNKVKRTLMQLVKVLQNMANGSLALLKWPGLINNEEELSVANTKIKGFLQKVSCRKPTEYPFEIKTNRPIAEFRYLHKFIYTYVTTFKLQFLLSDTMLDSKALHDRIELFREFDHLITKLGLPKPSVQLQLSQPLKSPDSNGAETVNDFMTKMSLAYVDQDILNLVHSSIFYDGTPVVVVNFKRLQEVQNDMPFLVFKLFETTSQVWDNKFYVVFDFTEYISRNEGQGKLFEELMDTYAPQQYFDNCNRAYYFNINYNISERAFKIMRSLSKNPRFKSLTLHCYSLTSPQEIINRLCLDPHSSAVSRDTRVQFDGCHIYDTKTCKFRPVSLRLGRKYIQICDDNVTEFMDSKDLRLVEIYRLADLTKCEVSQLTNHPDEFTISLVSGHEVTLRSAERQEILRFLYYSTSRLQKQTSFQEVDKELEGEHFMPWFGRLYNIVFQGLLSRDEEVKTASGLLFSSLSLFFGINFGIETSHAKNIAFPANTSDFVNSISTHLATNFPSMSYRFFKAFFDNFDKMSPENKLSSVIYLSPWVDNIYESIYLENEDQGPERVAELVRQTCRMTLMNKQHIAFLIDYVWKKLFKEVRIIPTLVDEVVAFAIDNKNDSPDWAFIIQVVCPSVEVCGEVISRLIECVNKTRQNDSTIAEKSNLLEIKVLVKICSSLFFNSYVFARLYLADIFFLATLFIDNVYLDFGADLQKLLINVIQSFFHKPDLTPKESQVVDATIEYFSDQRAKMLFGLTRDLSTSTTYSVQLYNRAMNFELLCDYLNDFITNLGVSDDISNWRLRWCLNAIDVAFLKDLVFQSRAILVVGILAKRGIGSSTACNILKLAANNPSSRVEYLTYSSVAIARMLQGLPGDSVLHSVLIWPHLCYGLLSHTNLYQSATLCLMTSVLKISEAGLDFMELSFAQRKYLEPHITKFEESTGICFKKDNMGTHIFMILTRGLRVQQFKHTSLNYIKKIYQVRCDIAGPQSSASKSTDLAEYHFTAYLVFIYFTLDDDNFAQYMEDLGYSDFTYVESNGSRIPQVVVDYCSKGSDISKLVMVLAAQFFNTETTNALFKLRFLNLYYLLLIILPENGFFILHLVRTSLEQELINSSHTQVVELVSEILMILMNGDAKNDSYYRNELQNLLETNGVRTFFATTSPTDCDREDISRMTKILRVMAYRIACMHVEGLALED